MQELSILYDSQHVTKTSLPPHFQKAIYVSPIPRNIHPVHHQERRHARASAMHQRFRDDPDVCYVDAADYHPKRAMAIVAIDGKGNSRASAYIYTNHTGEGEGAAIALAVASTTAKTIVNDSKTASQNYEIGRISNTALHILRSVQAAGMRNVQISWTPAHASLPGNELAHEAARGSSRDCPDDAAGSDQGARDRLVTYRYITQHYRTERQKYPVVHPTLNRRQSVAWRQLQANAFPNLALFNHIYPDLYND